MVSEHLDLQGATAGFAEVGAVCGSLKEEELSKTSLNDQGKQDRNVVAQAAGEKDPPEVIKREEEEELKSRNESGGLMEEDEDKAEEGEVTRQLEAPSPAYLEPGTGSKIYFETSSKSCEEEFAQSYYELGAEGEELHGGPESAGQKVGDQADKRARAQRSLSLNVPAGSSAGRITGAGPKAFSGGLLAPLRGSFDQSETPSLTSQQQLLPAVSVTPTSTEISEESSTDLETPERSEKLSSSVDRSAALSEMLDLAGVLPRPSSERRDLDLMRRKSMPSNVLGLSGSSLASLEASRLGQENRFEDQGYCVFSEYSGPVTSPADVAPPPVDCLHQCFPSVEREVGGDLENKEAEKVYESSQKLTFEKKDSPVKSSLALEKAVPVGLKPDRLRIPTTSSKDRLTELRLETGLPGDLKIQAIPEVDVEKDPSREASPIPPDTSFTFGESGNEAPPTSSTPKSPKDGVLEVTLEQTTMGHEGEKIGWDKEKGKESHEDTRTEAKVADGSSKDTHIQNIFSPKPFASSTVIVIPQAQVEEEADDEDVEIAEEPQEVMEDPAAPPGKEQAQMSPIRDAEKARENDPKSGDEWSQSSNNGEDGEPATDSSHLSPYSDYDRGEKKVLEVADIQKDTRKEELGGQTKKGKVEDKVEMGEEMKETSDVLCQAGEAENTETTQDVSCMDTDSGWMDSQGTQSLYNFKNTQRS